MSLLLTQDINYNKHSLFSDSQKSPAAHTQDIHCDERSFFRVPKNPLIFGKEEESRSPNVSVVYVRDIHCDERIPT